MGIWCTDWLVDWPGKTPNSAVAELEAEHWSIPMVYYPMPSYDRKSNYLACSPISSCPLYICLGLRNLPQYLQIHPSASFLRTSEFLSNSSWSLYSIGVCEVCAMAWPAAYAPSGTSTGRTWRVKSSLLPRKTGFLFSSPLTVFVKLVLI